MADCANCPLRTEVRLLTERMEKSEAVDIVVNKFQTDTLVWQATVDQKFVRVEEAIDRLVTTVETRLKPVEDGINAIKDKPVKRLDALTLIAMGAILTTLIGFAFKFFTK